MKFFLPATKDEEEAAQVYEAIRKFAKNTTGSLPTDRRIFAVRWRHGGQEHHAEVGQPAPRVGEVVVAILEGVTYLVCTGNRGVWRGIPILVGRDEALSITDFDR